MASKMATIFQGGGGKFITKSPLAIDQKSPCVPQGPSRHRCMGGVGHIIDEVDNHVDVKLILWHPKLPTSYLFMSSELRALCPP